MKNKEGALSICDILVTVQKCKVVALNKCMLQVSYCTMIVNRHRNKEIKVFILGFQSL